MLLSKGRSAWKAVNLIRQSTNNKLATIRNSHTCNYRSGGTPAPKALVNAAIIVQGYAWWWVLWHLVTEPEHIFGEFEYPDPRKFTDAELGLPPDE